jgi:hypothetical protein
VGSRSKGPRRDADTLTFVYHRTLKKGPPGESKLARRARRWFRDTFRVNLAKEFAVGAQSREAKRRRGPALKRTDSGIAVAWPELPQRQRRQEPLCRAKTPGVSRRNVRLFRRVVKAERKPDGSGPTIRDFINQWGRLSHRQKGRYRQTLERRATQ